MPRWTEEVRLLPDRPGPGLNVLDPPALERANRRARERPNARGRPGPALRLRLDGAAEEEQLVQAVSGRGGGCEECSLFLFPLLKSEVRLL